MKTKIKTPYEQICFLPYMMAEMVANQPYTGQEWSEGIRSAANVEKYEALRQKMTPEQINEYAKWVDRRCRYCYENNVEWFMKLVKSKTNQGRDQLYVYMGHWLASYLHNPGIVNRE